jgi:SAM-dependent methyltransferase
MPGRKSWYNNDTFWELWGPVIFDERRIANTPEEVTNLIALLNMDPGDRILDLCCGIGRHSLELARRGFKVTGVDRTLYYLSVATAEATREKLNVEFVNEDMRNFYRPSSFNVIVNVFASFGYFENPDDDRQVVLNMYKSLKKGGRFLIDVQGKETLAAIFRERDWNRSGDDIVLQERKVSQDWSWMENRWILIKDKKIYENSLSHRLYSASELKSLLKDCGFEDAKVFGDFKGSPYNQRARRLIVVGYK